MTPAATYWTNMGEMCARDLGRVTSLDDLAAFEKKWKRRLAREMYAGVARTAAYVRRELRK